MVITVEDVSMHYPVPRRYREYLLRPFAGRTMSRALTNVSLSVAQGERVGFLGPNGAGKTTLLKLIKGLLLPSSGRITVNGCDTLTRNDEVRALCSLVVNEERSFYWRLTGEENLEFYGVLENLTGRRLKKRIAEVLDLVGLAPKATQRVGTYSTGMRQRLAIARGLLTDASVLILDEPTRALDPEAAEELVRLILDTLHADLAKTLLIATHRLEEARILCNRLCVLSVGTLTADESMDRVAATYPALLDFYREAVAR